MVILAPIPPQRSPARREDHIYHNVKIDARQSRVCGVVARCLGLMVLCPTWPNRLLAPAQLAVGGIWRAIGHWSSFRHDAAHS